MYGKAEPVVPKYLIAERIPTVLAFMSEDFKEDILTTYCQKMFPAMCWGKRFPVAHPASYELQHCRKVGSGV